MACTCGDNTTININVPGLDTVLAGITRLEQLMANETVVLGAISAKLDAIFADVRALLVSERAQLSDEGQVQADNIVGALDAFAAEIGDADGSETPPPADDSTDDV